ncbi:MAG: hypothetical protein IJ260_03340 [Butyrivibrio sp.]|nr:hypothetical protein [Butyrivibrio sp.]
MLSRVLTDENRKRISDILFFLALTIELVLMIVEKSEIHIGFESYVFRVTFLLTLIAMVIMKRTKREWIVTSALMVFTFVCYELSGKNDLLRVAVFLMAARYIDLKKAMKYRFFVSLSGFSLIALLSILGVLGDIVRVADYGRGIPDEARLVLGFGHPNTLFGCVYVLVLMWLWIYGEKASLLMHAALILISFVFASLTRSRTGMIVLAMTLVLGLLIRLVPKIRDFKALYVLEGLFIPGVCIYTAVIAASYAGYVYTGIGRPTPRWFWRLEEIINYRISSLYYGVEDRGGVLHKWKLFAGHTADGYFDMGWVRLFYWYGIIPTALIVVAMLLIMYVCYKKRDMWTMLIILSVSVYTIVEATFVSRYIGRAFFLLIAGVYLGELIKGKNHD